MALRQQLRRGFLLSALTAMGLASPSVTCNLGDGESLGRRTSGGSGGYSGVATTDATDAGSWGAGAGMAAIDPGTAGTNAGASSTVGAAGASGSTAAAGAGGSAGSAGETTLSSAGAQQKSVVALVQASASQAADLTEDDVAQMVAQAVEAAGGLGFITDGQTVVLKPNLLTPYVSCWSGGASLSPTVNGVTTDYRVTKAVAALVRQRNPSGTVLVMEGSNRNTRETFRLLGYTQENFGDLVNEFVALEGTGCSSRDDSTLVQRPSLTGKLYWVNERYVSSNVVISIGALKTHSKTGVTGCVKNLGIGATPSARYSVSTNDGDCTRNMSQASLPSYIDHSRVGLGEFISDFYSVRPADFAVLDGLQGLQHGPCTPKAPDSDRMNMRLILAAKNAIALDATEARIINCDPERVLYLSRLTEQGFGPIRADWIELRGRRQGSEQPITVDDLRQTLASGVTDVCAL